MVPLAVVDGGAAAEPTATDFDAHRIGPQQIERETSASDERAPVEDDLLNAPGVRNAVRGGVDPSFDRAGAVAGNTIASCGDKIVDAVEVEGVRGLA